MTDLFERLSALSPKRLALLALELQEKLDAAERARTEPIAIIGMACRLPGADTPEAYWEVLRDGVDCIREIPASRWDVDEYYDPDPDTPGKIATRWGGFLDDIDRFEPQFFGISPREARSLDPQQRLLLEVSWEALERAGVAPDALHGSATGVYVGVCNGDYGQMLMDGDGQDFDMYLSTGNAGSVASGRLSYVLGLQGPSLTVDTACSSSLVAVHLAVQALRDGSCCTALAGGVNVILSPKTTMTLSRAKMMAADGRCKAFDARADGFVRGEGCGVVVLKRLRDAVADGDTVLAVIRGSAVNQDGRSNGLTAPNGPSQVAVIRAAIADAGVDATDVSYIEAHGTGTALGDPIEAQALGAALGAGRTDGDRLMVGTAKANLGHLESAAGIAGLLKVVLALQHGEIPPLLHLTEPNPYIPWAELPLDLPTAPTPWAPPSGRRIAGVSSFGFSGTNAHVVVEAAPPVEERAPAADRPVHLLTLSGRSDVALRDLAGRFAHHLDAHPTATFADVAYTANIGRTHLPHRLALVAADAGDAAPALAAFARGDEVERVASGVAAGQRAPEVAFLFTGHGAQYVDMGRTLYGSQPVYRAAIDRCAERLAPLMDRPLLDVLFPAGSGDQLLDDMAYAQPALFAVEYALAELWQSWGVRPTAVAGHSVGEYVAAVVAGVMSLDDGLQLVAARGRLMSSLPPDGQMATVFAPEARVALAVASHGGRVSIAAVNGPQSITLSGTKASLQPVLDELRDEGVQVRILAIPVAAHSPQVDPILEAFERVAATVRFQAPQLDIVSGMTGRMAAGDELTTARYWRDHLRQPVRFADAFQAIHDKGTRIFLEIGPHPTLLGMGRHIVAEHECAWLPSLRSCRDDWDQMLASAATLSAWGVDLDWAAFDAGYERRKVVLPTTPFQRERYWIERRARRTRASAGEHPLLGRRVLSPALDEIVFESDIGATWPGFLDHHRIYGTSLLPSPAYLEMALTAAETLGAGPFAIEDFGIREALILPEEGERSVQVVLHAQGDAAHFEVFSRAAMESSWTLHATGRLAPAAPVASSGFDAEAVRARCGERIAGDDYYSQLAALGLEFGTDFRGVAEVWRRDGEALGRVVLPAALGAEAGQYGIHPAFLDACFHVLGAPMPAVDEQHAYLLIGIDRFRLHQRPAGPLWNHTVLHSGYEEAGSTFSGDIRLYDDDGRLVAEALGLQLKYASRDAMLRATRQFANEWLYEVQWQPKAREGSDGAARVEPSLLAEELRPALLALGDEHGVEAYGTLMADLDSVAAGYAVLALERLGLGSVHEHLTTTALADRLGVVPRHRLLFERLLAVLAGEGRIRRVGEDWEVVAGATTLDEHARGAVDELRLRFPGAEAEVSLVERCGSQLADVLKGQVEPLELLFPHGSQETTERIYRDTPVAAVLNTMVGDAVAAVAHRSADRPVRILEVGGGTAATTLSARRALPEGRGEYWFTDISPLFTARAQERFADDPAVHCRTLDIERDPADQGFAAERFDVVIAANVVHATADVRRSLDHARRLLAPGGVLLLVEGVRASTWVDITFGLTEGWWRFSGDERRPHHPLLDRSGWLDTLAAAGFEEATSITGADEGDAVGQALVIATASDQPVGDDDADRWIVVGDAADTGAWLVELLERRGEAAVLLPTVAGVPGAITAGEGRLRLLYLGALDAPPLESTSLDHLADDQAASVGGALAVTQALIASGRPAQLWIVTRGAQPAGGTVPAPAQATAWGLGRVIAVEHPELWGGLVDLALDGTPATDAAALLEEVWHNDGEDQVALRADERLVARLVRSAPGQLAPPAWPADGSYLISGGLGGLGLKIARWMAEGGARTLVLTGRHGLPARDGWDDLDGASRQAGQVTAVRAIEALGAEVIAVAADVADPVAMGALMDRFGTELPPLRGVIHAAAALGNASVDDMTQDDLAAMLRPKVNGTWLLHQLTRDLALDFFVLFSSTTALWGSRDLAHYAAANQFLDAFAHFRHAQGLPAVSVNWGTWDEMRVASAEERDVVASAGLHPMPSDQALQVLGDVLGRADIAQLAVASVDWDRLKAIYEARRRRPFLSLVASRRAATTGTRTQLQPELATQLAAAPPQQRHDMIVTFLRDEVARALGMQPASTIDVEQGLFEMGMDSLMSVELKSRIEQAVGANLPSTLTFNYPNIAALAGYLLTDTFADLTGADAAPDDAPPPADDHHDAATELTDDLSEDDLAEMFAARLTKMQGSR